MKKKLWKQISLFIVLLLSGIAFTATSRQGWISFVSSSEREDYSSASRFSNVIRTFAYVQKNYIKPDRIKPAEMLKSSLKEVQKFVPEILAVFNGDNSFTLTVGNASKVFSSPLTTLQDLAAITTEFLSFIEKNYNGDVEIKDIEALALNGALNSLDPHSAFFTPESYKEFEIDTGGNFGGLGIVITSKDGQLTIVSPIEDTPAWRAGLKSGDIITEIDDESTINMSLMKAVQKMRGKPGTKVKLVIERKGRSSPFTVILARAIINIDSIKSTLINENEGSVGYIRIKRFQKDTALDFIKALKRLQSEAKGGFKGLIIDLRDNPGGLLNEAINIADLFLMDGTIVSTVGANKAFIETSVARKTGTEPYNYPVVVLLDEGSASASEIVAGALKANGRALLVGMTSFGKGSVQTVYPLDRGAALKLTISQYLTAGKYSIQNVGVTPDIMTIPVVVDKEYMDIQPNKRHAEESLDKHLEQLTAETSKEKIRIAYFKPYESEEEIEKARSEEYKRSVDVGNDFDVKLASKLILASKEWEPDKIIEDGKGVINQLQEVEREKISAKLAALGINWESGETKETPSVQASVGVNIGGRPQASVMAGQEAELVLGVTNKGNEPIFHVEGVAESDNPIVDEKEFVIGKINPNETKYGIAKVKIPANTPSKLIPFTITIKSDDKTIGSPIKSTLKVVGLQRPKFSFNYTVQTKKVGDISKNTCFDIAVKIKNVGSGAAKDTSVFIANKKDEEGAFIEKGREVLGNINPGEIKSASLRVISKTNNPTHTLVFSIFDKESGEYVSMDLVMAEDAIFPKGGIWHEGPTIKVASKEIPILVNAPKYNLKGEIIDNAAVKDYFIFVNDEKVWYASNPSESREIEFNTNLKLKEGENNVVIIARDNEKIPTTTSLAVQRGDYQ